MKSPKISATRLFDARKRWRNCFSQLIRLFFIGININLTPQLEEMVRQKVVSGLYTSASEVVREALRLMEEKDQLRLAKLMQLRQDIQEGLDSGPATSWDAAEIKRQGRAKKAAQSKSHVNEA